MHAHYRLLGPGPKIAGDRSEYVKMLERQIAIRVFEMLRSGGGGGKNDGSGDDSIDDCANHHKTDRKVWFYRVARGGGKVWQEPVDEGWALHSESRGCRVQHYTTRTLIHTVFAVLFSFRDT